jgi:hypothetical protein
MELATLAPQADKRLSMHDDPVLRCAGLAERLQGPCGLPDQGRGLRQLVL